MLLTKLNPKTRSGKFLALLSRFDEVTIVMHDNPDPDAIAAGWGLQTLIEERLRRPVAPVGGGAIVRAENRHMVDLLSPPIELVNELSVHDRSAVVLVDCGLKTTNHLVTRLGISPVAVIDHHLRSKRSADVPYVDARPDVAACASIVASYLQEQGVEPGEKLATAMLYALRSETCGFETHHSDLDRSVVRWLTDRADPAMLAEIENAPLSREYFGDLALALQNTTVFGDAALCLLPRAEGAEIVGELADLLVRCRSIRRVLSGAVVEGDLVVSVRTERSDDSAARLVQTMLKGLGSGGGHTHRAGGKVPGVNGGPMGDQVKNELRRRRRRAAPRSRAAHRSSRGSKSWEISPESSRMESEIQDPWTGLAEVTETGSVPELSQFLEALPAGDVALVLSRLTDEQQTRVLTALPPEQAADLIEQLSNVQAVDLLEQLEPRTAAAILDQLPSDEQADLIGDLNREEAEAILREMAPAEAKDARKLSQYADDVAGGLMVTEFLRYREHVNVGDVIQDMREHADEYRDYDVQYAYVCDGEDRLTGVLRLRDLLLSKQGRPIAELMIRDPISVTEHTRLDDLADLFERYHFLGVPVTDGAGKLLGVIQQGAVAEAWGDRQNSDFLKTQGIVGGEEIRAMPLLRRSSRRLAWLSVNILLNVLAASVIAVYQETLSAVIALAVFLPIISDMSGCSGNQAVAVSLRELALGLLRPGDVLRVWLQEVSVGLINGLALGLLIAGVALLWKGNPYLGLVVGLALALNTVVAVSIGGTIPLVLKRFNMDPAIASGPILTTVTDMCGFFFVLGLATVLLARLTT